MKTKIWLYKYLIEKSLWAIARIWGYPKYNKQIPIVFVAGVNYQEQSDWWEKQIPLLNKKRKKIDKKKYGI